jgi:hypothetical protein
MLPRESLFFPIGGEKSTLAARLAVAFGKTGMLEERQEEEKREGR